MKKEKKVSHGNLRYRHPGHLHLVVNQPQKIIYVNNSKKSWYYTAPFIEGEPGEVTVNYNAKEGALIRLFDILRKGLKNNLYYRVNTTGKEATLTFIRPGMMETQIRLVKIVFAKEKMEFSQIERMEVNTIDDKSFKLKFNSIRTGVKFDDSIFSFKVPPNTRISP